MLLNHYSCSNILSLQNLMVNIKTFKILEILEIEVHRCYSLTNLNYFD